MLNYETCNECWHSWAAVIGCSGAGLTAASSKFLKVFRISSFYTHKLCGIVSFYFPCLSAQNTTNLIAQAQKPNLWNIYLFFCWKGQEDQEYMLFYTLKLPMDDTWESLHKPRLFCLPAAFIIFDELCVSFYMYSSLVNVLIIKCVHKIPTLKGATCLPATGSEQVGSICLPLLNDTIPGCAHLDPQNNHSNVFQKCLTIFYNLKSRLLLIILMSVLLVTERRATIHEIWWQCFHSDN